MDGIKEYIYAIVCASVICGIFIGFSPNKGVSSVYMKQLVGMVMMIALISPLRNINIQKIPQVFTDYKQDAQSAADIGQRMANSKQREIITQQACAYILDKATSLGLDITVEISLDEEMGCPWEVRLEGSVSPYAKQRLGNIIAQELAVPEERQIWIG